MIKRGASPRIVTADVVGTGGRTRVDGATLRARLGLLDTWAYFTSIASRKAPPTGTGGAQRRHRRPARRGPASPAPCIPARVGAEVQIQLRTGGRWETVASTLVRHGGNYRAAVATAGTYRAIFAGDAGPSIRVR